MTHINSIFTACLVLLTLSCSKEFIEPPVPEPEPFTENTFTYELQPGTLKPDTNVISQFLENTGTTLIFSPGSLFGSSVKAGDIIFAPFLTDTFHLTRMAYKVQAVETQPAGIYIHYSEPKLKEVYDFFSLQINNENQIETRDTMVDWHPLTDPQKDEVKLIDFTLIQQTIPLGSGTNLTLKIGNINAQADFQYRFATQYLGDLDALVNFEFGVRNLVLKSFSFVVEAEIKGDGMTMDNPTTSFLGITSGEVNMARVPLPILTAFGIPLTVNVDFSGDYEVSLAGKMVLGVNFGDLHFLGDPLVVRYDRIGLDDLLWLSINQTFDLGVLNAITNQVQNIDIISYPNQIMATGNSCLQMNGEITGLVKPSIGVGISFSLVGFPGVGLGVYTDAFIEFAGKVAVNSCVTPTTATFSPQACFEINRGLKFPYFMATYTAAPPTALSYNFYKLSFLGEVKNNWMKFPASCNPFADIFFELGEQHIGSACSGERIFIHSNVVPPEALSANTSYKLILDGQTINNLPYHAQNALYLDQHNLGHIQALENLPFEIFDQTTNTRLALGHILAANCSTEGCSVVTDPHLPTYGEQSYCAFIPELLSYNREWIRENMYYTSRPSGFDPFEDGRCFDDQEELCKAYGRYYTWDAANGKRRNVSAFPTWPGTDICPLGYHIPTKAEWQALIDAAGGAEGFTQLAHESWPGIYNYDRNLSGFSAYPFGFFVPGHNAGNPGFQGLGSDAYFWTATEIESISGQNEAAWAVHITAEEGIKIVPAIKTLGMNCRCIKD